VISVGMLCVPCGSSGAGKSAGDLGRGASREEGGWRGGEGNVGDRVRLGRYLGFEETDFRICKRIVLITMVFYFWVCSLQVGIGCSRWRLLRIEAGRVFISSPLFMFGLGS
jgi:hypothetical protein